MSGQKQTEAEMAAVVAEIDRGIEFGEMLGGLERGLSWGNPTAWQRIDRLQKTKEQDVAQAARTLKAVQLRLPVEQAELEAISKLIDKHKNRRPRSDEEHRPYDGLAQERPPWLIDIWHDAGLLKSEHAQAAKEIFAIWGAACEVALPIGGGGGTVKPVGFYEPQMDDDTAALHAAYIRWGQELERRRPGWAGQMMDLIVDNRVTLPTTANGNDPTKQAAEQAVKALELYAHMRPTDTEIADVDD